MRRTELVVTKKIIRNNGDYDISKETIPVPNNMTDDMLSIDGTVKSMLRNVDNDHWFFDKMVTKIEFSIEAIQTNV